MIALTRRALTLSTIAALIIALATIGGYRLAGLSSPGHDHARLATGTYSNTYVSGTGDNTKNTVGCPRVTPCVTLPTAYAVTSPGGQISAIDVGRVDEGLGMTIAQALTIDGGPGRALILTTGDGFNVSAGPNDVVILRHLQIHHMGSGAGDAIYFGSGKALILDDVTVEGFSGYSIYVNTTTPASVTITNSRIQDGGSAGIAIAPKTGMVQVSIANSVIQSHGQAGVAVAPSGGTAQVTVSHSQIANNYYGIVAQDGSDVSLTDSVVTGSTSIGVGCQTFGSGPCTIQTAHDRLDHNGLALWMNHASGTAQITETLSDDDIFSNTYGIYGDFGGTLNAASFGNNRFVNNAVDGSASSTMTQK